MLISQIDDTLKEGLCLFIDHETCTSILHHIFSSNITLQIGNNIYFAFEGKSNILNPITENIL